MTVPAGGRPGRLAAAVRERELDALLVTDLVNLRWLTGFTGSNGLAVVGADQGSGATIRRFLTDFRYLTQIEDQLAPEWSKEIHQDVLLASVSGPPADGEGAAVRLGFDDATMSVKDHARLAEAAPEGVELVPAAGAVEALRAIKDPLEIAALRAAAQLADDAFQEVVGGGIVGRTERDVALELEIAMRRRGASGASFEPIVAAGPHGALPHAQPRDVPIPAGALVVIDWGAMLDGYASDCTRTVATGELAPHDAEIYELVLHAQMAALSAVRPGPLGKEVDAVARDIIDAAGHADHFGHGLGHGVGMEVHEGPRLSKLGEAALVAGNVVTVEPGVYVPGVSGVRIEDLVVVTQDGHDVLSTLPKSLRVVG